MTSPVSSVRPNALSSSPAEEEAQACLAEPAAHSEPKSTTPKVETDPWERHVAPAVEALLLCSIEITKGAVQCGIAAVGTPPPVAALICGLEGASAGKCVADAYFDSARTKN